MRAIDVPDSAASPAWYWAFPQLLQVQEPTLVLRQP